jgi:tRNA modification GTPase
VHPSFRIVSVEAADVKVCIISLTELLDKLEKDEPGLNTMSASLVDSDTIFVLNKTDLVNMTPQLRARISSALGVEDNQDKEVCVRLWKRSKSSYRYMSVACGPRRLMLDSVLYSRFDLGTSGETLLVTRERHRFHLEECFQCLNTFLG